MKGWLLDTNVVSELQRHRPNKKVVAFVSSQPLDLIFVSEVSFAEIRFGIELSTDPIRRSSFSEWLENVLRPMFEDRVLRLDEDSLLKWRLIIEDGRKRGHTYSHPDVLIAAIAFHHGLTVVTRDTSEFVAAQVPVFNPWIDKRS
jgi:toxin FitB